MNEIMDFSKVVIREEELRCLYALQDKGSVFIMPPQLSSYLSYLGFIAPARGFDDGQHFVLAETGERYLKYLDEEAREKKKLIHEENFREWTGIFISSLLSIVSIIIAVFAR